MATFLDDVYAYDLMHDYGLHPLPDTVYEDHDIEDTLHHFLFCDSSDHTNIWIKFDGFKLPHTDF